MSLELLNLKKSYREPDGKEDDLRGTDLKEQFYSYLQALTADLPQDVAGRIELTLFPAARNTASRGHQVGAQVDRARGTGAAQGHTEPDAFVLVGVVRLAFQGFGLAAIEPDLAVARPSPWKLGERTR